MSTRGTSALRSMGSIDSASSHESARNLAAAFAAAETNPPNGVPRSPSRYPVNGGVHAYAAANGGASKDQLRPSFGAAMAGELCFGTQLALCHWVFSGCAVCHLMAAWPQAVPCA